MDIAVTGGTGFMGAPLVGRLCSAGHRVRVLTRRPETAGPLPSGARAVPFDPAAALVRGELEGCEAVVHLAGEPVGQRWTAAHKRRVLDSRVTATTHVARAAVEAKTVRTLISASAIGYYGLRGAEELDESSPPGDDFLATVCRRWEEASLVAAQAGLRLVNPRFGVVLHPSGGALERMLTPFRLGVGGIVGSGEQFLSWIHREDALSLVQFALERDDVEGPLNVTAPQPVNNRTFTAALGRALHRPAVATVPAMAVRLALGEMASLVLEGQRVLPRKALSLGFQFTFATIDEALADLLRRSEAG